MAAAKSGYCGNDPATNRCLNSFSFSFSAISTEANRCEECCQPDKFSSTSWKIDINLPDNAFYWWRSRATDGGDIGPWSAVATFAVNEINNPPNEVEPATPLNGGTLYSLTELLIWRTTDDPDPGDSIIDYHLEIDDQGDFSSPLVSVEGITVAGVPDGAGHLVGLSLDQLEGVDSIRAGGWLWRIRARDSRFGYGPWSTATASFRIVSDYERWVIDHFTPEERLDLEISGPAVDDDGDGVPLIIEFGCGMDMEASSWQGLPKCASRLLRERTTLPSSSTGRSEPILSSDFKARIA